MTVRNKFGHPLYERPKRENQYDTFTSKCHHISAGFVNIVLYQFSQTKVVFCYVYLLYKCVQRITLIKSLRTRVM